MRAKSRKMSGFVRSVLLGLIVGVTLAYNHLYSLEKTNYSGATEYVEQNEMYNGLRRVDINEGS